MAGTLAMASSGERGSTGWADIAERVVSHLDTGPDGQFFRPKFVHADVLAARAWAGRRLEVSSR